MRNMLERADDLNNATLDLLASGSKVWPQVSGYEERHNSAKLQGGSAVPRGNSNRTKPIPVFPLLSAKHPISLYIK